MRSGEWVPPVPPPHPATESGGNPTMQILEGVRLALQQIRQEKLKSFFSLIGVIIGVMFLIMVVSVVEGMDRYIEEDFAQEIFGVQTIQVVRFPSVQVNTSASDWRAWSRRPPVTLDEADAIRRQLSVPGRVGVESFTRGSVRTDDGREAEGLLIFAISEEVLTIRTFQVDEGRPFSRQEAARGVPVVILGTSAADALFPDGSAVGERVRIRGFPYRVVGVLEDQGTVLGIPLNDRVLIPAISRAGRTRPERGAVDGILVQVDRGEDLPIARMDIEAAMRMERRLRPADPNNFGMETADESLAFWDNISNILFIALPALVGISLVVGGIVIMNIMLVSVMQRTREVGIRKALGARRRDIVGQFLVESTTLSAAGALLGVALGVGLAAAIRTFTPLPTSVALPWVILAVVLGMTVGIAAGVYPAYRASQLDPVEALRSE
ncbi:MAG: ABC transporter permease [Gemmatimonadales bacterium]|nr:MAG: ABC transporter permease [Gemmatimonadales bacterium]